MTDHSRIDADDWFEAEIMPGDPTDHEASYTRTTTTTSPDMI